MSKTHIYCRNCRKALGFIWGRQPLPEFYCYSCEMDVTSREVERQKSYAQYREALNQQVEKT